MPDTRRFNDNEQYPVSDHNTTRLDGEWDYTEDQATSDPRYNAHGGRHPQQETFPGIPPRKGLLDRVLDNWAKKNSQ